MGTLALPDGLPAMQERGGAGGDAARGSAPAVTVPVDTAVTTRHTVTMADGREIPYSATLGFLPVYDDDGHAVASLFYTYYRRTDVQDTGRRPLTFSFNGGPGSASVWMHLGYTSPWKLRISDEGFPVQPYGVEPNPHTILDATDIVYVNPVNTGFSRALPGVEEEQFFGVEDDVEYLADWIDLFVSRQKRWDSPKYLIGESYGTTRVSGLAGELQDAHWMSLNGVILVSPTGLGIDRDGPVSDALILPHYAATAWYHEQLPADLQSRDLTEVLDEVEAFTLDTYLPALARGGSLSAERKRELAETVGRYAGVDPEFVLDHNLAIPISPWRKELMREEGFTVGRLDARYRGVDRSDAGDRYDYDPALASWNHAFAPAINEYLRDQMGFETDLQYNVFGPVYPWDRSGNRTGERLRGAMAANPFLKVMVQSGYYDGGTDYFSAMYNLWHMDPSSRLQDRMRFEAYRSGHMMYLRSEDLVTSNQDIRDFIEWSIPEEGARARW
jgi:carboxypeptidase C (cathepsin A)